MFVPSGASQGPMDVLFLIGGVSPWGPHRNKHGGHFSLGALLCLAGNSSAHLLRRRAACVVGCYYEPTRLLPLTADVKLACMFGGWWRPVLQRQPSIQTLDDAFCIWPAHVLAVCV